MTITVKGNGDVKGRTTGVNVLYFFAILFLIIGGLIMLSGNLGGVVILIFAIIMWYMGKTHNIKAQQKKFDEYIQNNFSNFSPCPNCHTASRGANRYCPKCGTFKREG